MYIDFTMIIGILSDAHKDRANAILCIIEESEQVRIINPGDIVRNRN